MPKLKIMSPFPFETNITALLMSKLSSSVADKYGCSDGQVWVSWVHETEKRWFFEGRHFLEGELAFIDFELSFFRASSKCSVEELLTVVNDQISNAFPKAEIFGRYCEVKPSEAIYNKKILESGA